MYASIFDPLARLFAAPFTGFYAFTGSYAAAILLITVVVMIITTPLNLKQTKGMLEMQKLQPEVRRLQQLHRGDRQTLNQEMMKLYQEHKVNPLASCFPLLLQMPVFIGMFTLLRGLTRNTSSTGLFEPKYISKSSRLYKDLAKSTKMNSWGLDLAKSPAKMFDVSAPKGVMYVGFVAILAVLYWVQQRMIANRSASPTMSETQAKVMQYLPVAFAAFQILFPLGLVLYYMSQTVLRIGQQYYITKRFYHGEGSLGHQAQAASAAAREQSKADKATKAAAGGGGAGGGRPAGRPGVPNRSSNPTRPQPRGAAPARGRPTPRTPPRAAPPAKPKPPVVAKPPSVGKTAKPAKPAAGKPFSAPPPRPVKPAPVKPVKAQKPQKPQKPQA